MPITPESLELARKIADAEKADIYLYNGPINESGVGKILSAYSRHHSKVILLLTTNGGSANAAFRISRWFQAMYDEFAVLIVSYCKSAGTLIATGAHRLIMSPASGELGPLDIQLSRRDELWEQRSGLMLRSALTSLAEGSDELFTKLMTSIKVSSQGVVRFKLASEIATAITCGVMSPIYEQITPEGIGEDYQELAVALEYGKRLAGIGVNIDEDQIRHLVHEYPSHDFVIDAIEAKTLFRRVDDPSSDMIQMALKLQDLSFRPNSSSVTTAQLSKPEEQKSDEAKDKGGPDAANQPNNSSGPADPSDSSAA